MHIATTPFGRRTMSLGQIANQMAARDLPNDVVVQKWQVFQHIREARDALGATDRSLAILNALLSFYPDATLTADSEMIVWPSNDQLASRANGMPATTLRRHIAVLVQAGLVIRRDSPNGKRFARKGRGGEVEQAYGFDISPILARADEFRELAEAVQNERKALRVAKERLTLLRRDICKTIETAIEAGVPGHWGRVQQNYSTIVERLPRSATRALYEDIGSQLDELLQDIRIVLEEFINLQKADGNESQTGRHIQNTNPDSKIESEHGSRKNKEDSGTAEVNRNIRALPTRDLPLAIILDACPGMIDLVPGGAIRHWRDFLGAAELVRPMLAVSVSAWKDARAALGEQQAAITLAAIYQRADKINNAGGYLRSLTERAREGKFSTWPMIMALLRAKLEASKGILATRGMLSADPQMPGISGVGHGSPELLRQLAKRKSG